MPVHARRVPLHTLHRRHDILDTERQSLGGTDRLGDDARAQLVLDRILHDQIDWSAEDRFQPALDPEEVEEPQRLVELDQEVDIAVWT
jgi:hypothetical protein